MSQKKHMATQSSQWMAEIHDITVC